jgi:sodium-coupled neutral amino acid transporter 9
MTGELSEQLREDIIQQTEDRKPSVVNLHGSSAKHTSFQTINAIGNAMIGSSCLVLPILFAQSGIITALIVIIVIGLVSYWTCGLIVRHVKEIEQDLPQIILRLMGKKWYYAYLFLSSFELMLVGIIYYILMCNMIYPSIEFFFALADSEAYAGRDEITFSKFSFQYVSLISGVVCFVLINLRNLSFIIKLGHWGIFALYAYTVFIIEEAFRNMIWGQFEYSKIVWFTWDFPNLSGVLALAFIIHNEIVPIMKQNKNQNKNLRDLGIAYSITGFLYAVMGILGVLAIIGRQIHTEKANTVIDYFKVSDIGAFIIQIIFFSHLITAFPIPCYIARNLFFQIFYQEREVPRKWILLYNTIYALLVTIMGIFNVNPGVVIGFTGACVGYFITYFIPIGIHFTCIYVFSDTKASIEKSTVNGILIDHEHTADENKIKMIGVEEPYCNHNISDLSIAVRFMTYSLIFMFGFVLMVIQLIQIFAPHLFD